MLAKVVKNQSFDSVRPFLLPEIGNSNMESRSINQFLFPAVSEIQIAPEIEKVDASYQSNALPNIEDILQSARDEADRIIAQAEGNAVAIAQAANEKAVQEVQTQFDTEVSAKAAEIRQQLTETIENISALASEITSRAETDLVKLALQIAKKIVAREVTIDREIALTLVKVSLGKLHNRSVAEVHLNPEDFAFVQMHREKLDFRGSLELVEDRSISVGGCLIHTETGDIDARIESQFDEIAHGLFS